MERLKQVSEGEIYNYPERHYASALAKASANEQIGTSLYMLSILRLKSVFILDLDGEEEDEEEEEEDGEMEMEEEDGDGGGEREGGEYDDGEEDEEAYRVEYVEVCLGVFSDQSCLIA